MNAKGMLLVAPLVLVMVTSGCTVPGVGITLPCIIPGLGCTAAVVQTSDVIAITSMEVLPATILPESSVSVVAYVKNQGSENIPLKKSSDGQVDQIFTEQGQIVVDLYDYCQGMFDKNSIYVNCGSKEGQVKGTSCKIESIASGQMIPVTWTLTAGKKEQVPVKTDCELKISVKYPYLTSATTSITFVDYTEYQRQLSDGTFAPITSYISEGFGPLKPYITVEGQQPIPVTNKADQVNANLAFQVKNEGDGFVKDNSVYLKFESNMLDLSTITGANIWFDSENNDLKTKLEQCLEKCAQQDSMSTTTEKITKLVFIKKETPKCVCPISISMANLDKLKTEHITSSIVYDYEFRKSAKVTVEPKV